MSQIVDRTLCVYIRDRIYSKSVPIPQPLWDFMVPPAKNIFGGFRKPMKMAMETQNPKMAVELVRTVIFHIFGPCTLADHIDDNSLRPTYSFSRKPILYSKNARYLQTNHSGTQCLILA